MRTHVLIVVAAILAPLIVYSGGKQTGKSAPQNEPAD